MKTKNMNASVSLKMKSLLLVVGLLFISKPGICQKFLPERIKNIGIATSAMINADGYGGQYSPMLYYKNNRRSYFIGPIIQNKNFTLSGVQLNYDYTIVGVDAVDSQPDNKNVELFCFVSAAYHHNAVLGKRVLWEEKMANAKYEGDPCKLHFNSVEVYGGAGLKLRLFKNVKWMGCIGLGGYTSFKFPSNLYYNASNIGLILKTGISVDLAR